MRIGIGLLVTDETPAIATMARLVEAHGFDSIWIGEHSHCPVGTVHAYTRDGRVPEEYKRFLDPFVALTAAACATTRLRVGTSVLLPAEHNPIHLAKSVATLDLVSQGRVELGVGWGWNGPELENNGVTPSQRRVVMREKIEAMVRIWTDDVFSYSGEHVRLSESWAWPKPVQSPHPPLFLGAPGTVRNFAQIARWGQGWLPITKMGDEETFPGEVRLLREAFEAAGRDPASARVTLLETRTNTGPHTTAETFQQRLPDVRRISQYADWGVDRLVVSAPTYSLDRLERALDLLAGQRETWRSVDAR